MSKDNVLKKEFAKNDVNRLRNLVQGKYGEKVQQGVGFNKKDEFRGEGDVWEEDGRKWTVKNGIRQNITKFDKAKKAHVMPIFCPNCKKPMKKTFDKDYYNIHKKCFDCVIDFEHDLRKAGLFEEYEKNIQNAEIDGFIGDFKAHVEESLTQDNSSYVTEAGDVENWVGGLNRERVLEALDKTINHLEKMKK
tara:strand:+ start:86 stop:661 length:576 start_codon:yes stop_codon:yes gene_type:complete